MHLHYHIDETVIIIFHNLLINAMTLVALGTHHEHFCIGGKSCGRGGNRRIDMKLWRRFISFLTGTDFSL